MFWTIPIGESSTRVNTPLDAKSIRGIFFEIKNLPLVNYDSYVSLSVNGRDIMVDIPPYLFSRQKIKEYALAHYNDYFRDYKDVMVQCNLNVNNSEVYIKTKNIVDNSINIVLVYDTTIVPQENYEFFEVKELDLITHEDFLNNRGVENDYSMNIKEYNISTLYNSDRFFFVPLLFTMGTFFSFAYYQEPSGELMFPLGRNFNIFSNGNMFDNDMPISLFSSIKKTPPRKAMYMLNNVFLERKFKVRLSGSIYGGNSNLGIRKYQLVLGYKKI